MRIDQLDEAGRKAGRNLAGAEIELRRPLPQHRDFAAEIARAFRSCQPTSMPEDPALVRKILAAFDDLSASPRRPARRRAAAPAAAAPARVPPVPLPETIGLGFLICLEDGQVCRDLGRHLDLAHRLSPDQYRRRWGLPEAYPMLPPASHQERQAWRRRLAPPSEGGGPTVLRLLEETRRVEAGRTRRRHRSGAPAGLRHDRVKPVPGRRSEGPRPDGFRR
ncbi:MucR family transcriptional regulator [Inquilinus sp. CA228]|uniref:MucR family transcriptional regulator n=1 Tax=Inquilinus sp. CA228 TaxID=3455609 RepID=UPI003F8D44C3